jgi:hypothetical protein
VTGRMILAEGDAGNQLAIGPIYTQTSRKQLRREADEYGWTVVATVPHFSRADFTCAPRPWRGPGEDIGRRPCARYPSASRGRPAQMTSGRSRRGFSTSCSHRGVRPGADGPRGLRRSRMAKLERAWAADPPEGFRDGPEAG